MPTDPPSFEIVHRVALVPARTRRRARRRRPERASAAPSAIAALLRAFARLGLRGVGPQPWALSHEHDPLAFVLDAMTDAVIVWDEQGRLLYRNAAAEALGLEGPSSVSMERLEAGGRVLERRTARFREGDLAITLEVVRGARP